jgi:hypothetical protein
MIRGALHLHSTYSDGEFTLLELRELLVSSGCAFACVTDHAESLDTAKRTAYVEECRALSDHVFRFLPGLEYECEQRMHILGYGVMAPIPTRDPQEVMRIIGQHGGLSVIAHPKDNFFPWIESFDTLPDGIEAWNTKYDGQYAPRPSTFDLISRLRRRKPALHAFYGQDLHWKRQYRGLFVDLTATASNEQGVLDALAAGDFSGICGALQLPSSGFLATEWRSRFAKIHRRHERYRSVARSLLDWTKQLGLTIPAPLKSRLRRYF